MGHNKRAHQPVIVHRRNRTPSKEQSLWRFYRLPHADYLAMLSKGCTICRCDLTTRTPDVDHDHGCQHPGKGSSSCRACVRGLLCRSCNLRVGAFERGLNQDPDIEAYLGGQPVVSLDAQGMLF